MLTWSWLRIYISKLSNRETACLTYDVKQPAILKLDLATF